MKYLVIANMKSCVVERKKIDSIKNKRDKLNCKQFINNFKWYGTQSRKHAKLEILL